MREQDKLRKKRNKENLATNKDEAQLLSQSPCQQNKPSILPWLLLLISWLGFLAYFFVQ